MSSFNENLVAEFRANAGRVTGTFAETDLLLLTTTGRRSQKKVVSPLAYSTTGGKIVVAASNNGTDSHPAWFFNLQADPEVTLEFGDRTVAARAVVPDGAERDRLWAAHIEAMPAFGNYEETTDRVIPVVVLEPVDDTAAPRLG